MKLYFPFLMKKTIVPFFFFSSLLFIPCFALADELPEDWNDWIFEKNLSPESENELQRVFLEMEEEGLSQEIKKLQQKYNEKNEEEIEEDIEHNFKDRDIYDIYVHEIELQNEYLKRLSALGAEDAMKTDNGSISFLQEAKDIPVFNLTSSDVKSVTEVPNTKEMEVTIEEDENNEVWEEDGKISHGKEDFQAASADATPFIEYYDGIFDNPVESALYFLSQHQNEDGSVGSFRDSAKLLMTLNDFGLTESDQYSLLLYYVENFEPTNNREKAIKAQILFGLGDLSYQLLRDELMADTNSDGGIGISAWSMSDVMTTVEFLRLLRITDDNTENRETKAVMYLLLQTQTEENMVLSGNVTDYQATAELMDILSYYTTYVFSPDNFLSLLNISVSEEIYVLDRLESMVSVVSNHYDEVLGNFDDSYNLTDKISVLRFFERLTDTPNDTDLLREEVLINQSFGGNFGSISTTVTALAAIAVPDIAIESFTYTGKLENRAADFAFDITIKNNGYKKANNLSLSFFLDNHLVIETSLNQSIYPHQSSSFHFTPYTVGDYVIGDTDFHLYVEDKKERHYSDNWSHQSYTFSPPTGANSGLPALVGNVAVRMSDPDLQYNNNLLYVHFTEKPDPNRKSYALMFKKSSDSEWQSFILNLNNSNEFIVSMESTVIQNDTLYDFTIGAVDLGDISNFNPFSARRLYVTSTPQDHTGNIIGQLRSNYGTDIPVPISDVSGVLETYPSSDGKTYAFENIYNGTYAITVDAPYFDPLFTRVSVPYTGESVEMSLLSHLTEDTTPPTISALQVPMESMINQNTVSLVVTASDNVSLKETDFYYYNPLDGYWYYLGRSGFEENTSTFEWYLPSSFSGGGYRVKAIAWDYAGNASDEMVSDIFSVLPEYQVSGMVIRNSVGKPGITIQAKKDGNVIASTVTDTLGNYSFFLTNGIYEITPEKIYYGFEPETQSISVNGASLQDINFEISKKFGHVSVIVDEDDGAQIESPRGVSVLGDYVYVDSYRKDCLQVIDMSNPKTPIPIATLGNDEANGVYLDAPKGITVVGHYAYIAAYYSGALEIVDISDPKNPVHVGAIVNGDGGALIDGPNDVFVRGDYAYVTAYNSDTLEIIDISDPENPVRVGGFQDVQDGVTELNGPKEVVVVGDYAYVTVYNDASLQIFDISDPTLPSPVSSYSDDVYLNKPQGLSVSNNGYAYVSSLASNNFTVLDVHSPVAPTFVATLTNGEDGAILDNPYMVYTFNGYAMIVSIISDSLEIVDISPYYQGAPSFMVLPSSYDFGEVGINSITSSSFVVSNNGDGAFDISSIDLSGDSDFSIQSDTCSGETISPQESCTLEVNVHPLTVGLKNATITISSNDVNSPHIVHVNAYAIDESTIPSLTILEPDGNDDTAYSTFVISWKDEDTDSDATISFFYDSDTSGEDGIVIVENISENDEFDQYEWNTADIPEGEYYIYAIIEDGTSTSTIYSNGVVKILKNKPPVMTFVSNGGTADRSFEISWEDEDTDNNAEIFFFFDTDSSGDNGVLINTIAISEDDETDKYIWDTSNVSEGEYYLYAIMSDGVNDPETVFMENSVIIDHNASPTFSPFPVEASSDLKTVLLSWEDEDLEGDARISLYYSVDPFGDHGDVIVEDLSEDTENTEGIDWYLWDGSSFLDDDDEYFFYSVIDDGVNDPVITYFPNSVRKKEVFCSENAVEIRHPYTEECISVSNSCSVPSGWETCSPNFFLPAF